MTSPYVHACVKILADNNTETELSRKVKEKLFNVQGSETGVCATEAESFATCCFGWRGEREHITQFKHQTLFATKTQTQRNVEI